MSTTATKRPQPQTGARFRCADCGQDKAPEGRKFVRRRGVKVYVCTACVRPGDVK